MGCIFLKPRVNKWRYQRGNRSLLHNLKQSVGQSNLEEGIKKQDEDQDEEMTDDTDVDFDKLEFIIQHLLDSLKDEVTPSYSHLNFPYRIQ